MLTELTDGNQEQCVKYWPDEINEWSEWNINQSKMAPTSAEINGEIGVCKIYEGPGWEGSDGVVTKRTFHLFSNYDPNQVKL